MKKKYTLNFILALVLGAAALAKMLLQTFLPRLILPELDIPGMVLLVLASLLLEHYLAPEGKRYWVAGPLAAAVCFALAMRASDFVAVGLVPLGSAAPADLLTVLFTWTCRLILGGAVYALTVWVFDTVTDRISSGPVAKAAPVVSAVCLYLGAQCLMGIL